MTSKERVRRAISHRAPDRVPVGFEATPAVVNRLLREKNCRNFDGLAAYYQIDICDCHPDYIGGRTKAWKEVDIALAQSIYGGEVRLKDNGGETHAVMHRYPFSEQTTIKDVLSFDWITPDDFDYESVKRKCGAHEDKALIFGHEGPFQIATFMMEMSDLFSKMMLEPETAKALFDRFVQFELEFYERILIAGDGQIDIMRPHDDYGTQQSLLFSPALFEEFFSENTKKLADLAHRYHCFYQQHSCGAVRALIPALIGCGADVLEPLQKVDGLDPESLQQEFGGKIAFHGGIDTQSLLPFGSPEEVRAECRRYVRALGANGGYILMASQALERDVPTENIDALFDMRNRE